MAELLELVAGPHHHPATAGGIGGTDAAAAHDEATGGKVGTLDIGHQVRQRGIGIIHHMDAGSDDLPQVVGRDVGGHTHGDTGGAVDQQIGEAAGQHTGFLAALVKVGVPVHGVLSDIPQHFIGNFGKTGLRVTVGSGGIAIHGAKVAVAVHQHIAHGEILCQTHQSVVDGGVAVGVIPAQHVAHAGGGLLKGAVAGEVVLVHGVENTPVDGLQTVPHVGQRPAHDNGHGVFDVGLLHLRHQRALDNVLVREADLLGIVLGFLTHILLLLVRGLGGQIVPHGVHALDQLILLSSIPRLELFFPFKGHSNIRRSFVVDKLIHMIFCCKAIWVCVMAMLPESALQIIGHAHIHGHIRIIRENINVVHETYPPFYSGENGFPRPVCGLVSE